MSRPNNDHITERGRRFAERQQRREAFQQVDEEIRQDRSFPRSLRRVAEEALQFPSRQFSDEGSSLTSLREAESILQMLVGGTGDAEPFTTLESDSDSEESVASRYKSSHETPNDLEEDESDGSLTTEPTEEVPSISGDQQLPNRTEHTPTPPTEEVKDRIPSPPKEGKEEYTQPEQPYEEDTMPYPYPKYRDDTDAEAHVYAFLQTWEANHVSQRLTEPEAEWSKVAEFGMTLEGPAARWHAKHLPGSFATFKWSRGN